MRRCEHVGLSGREAMKASRLVAEVVSDCRDAASQRACLLDGLLRLCKAERAVMVVGVDVPDWLRHGGMNEVAAAGVAGSGFWESTSGPQRMAAWAARTQAGWLDKPHAAQSLTTCSCRLGPWPRGSRLMGMGIGHGRSEHKPSQSPRARRVLRRVCFEAAWHASRGSLAVAAENRTPWDIAADLPPRRREVFDGLLAGFHPKGIAHEMSLSVHTVRDHMRSLYADFGVNGRDELMAVFVPSVRAEPLLRPSDPGEGASSTDQLG